MTPTLAEKLAAYAMTLGFEDIPSQVVHQARRTMIDTLACGFGGYESEPGRIARELAALTTSTVSATVLCSGQQTSMDLAAFANDVMIRYLDFNDGIINKSGGHPSDSIPALLAAAETVHANGRASVTALVLAYEIYGAFSDAFDSKVVGVDHVTMGGIASAAGVGRLLGLTQQQIAEAINIYVAGNIALNQTRMESLSHWKACAYANADRNAMFAIQLAARGMTGPTPIFEGRNGFFKIVSREPLELTPFAGRGGSFQIMKTHLKQFALCNFAQTMVPALLQARSRVQDVAQIAEVHVKVSQKALNAMADPDKWRPRTRETADHSIPFIAAVVLEHGTVDESYFGEGYLADPGLLALADRVKCELSAEAERRSSENNMCELEVIMQSGERYAYREEYHRGHWRNPMTDADVEAKFRLFAGKLLPPARVDALLATLWKLESVPDLGRLVEMTVTT